MANGKDNPSSCSWQQRWQERLGWYGLLFLVYLGATLLTDALLMADTADYADSIEAYEAGFYYNFWEFGHLFWRPLGWLAYRASRPLLSAILVRNSRAEIMWTLLALNWVAGLSCVFLLYGLLSRICRRRWVIAMTCVAFIFAHAFLNYAQTGSSYIPGLALLLAGLYLLLEPQNESMRASDTGWLAGLALAGAVCLWVLYLWAIPAALASPLFLSRVSRRKRWGRVFQAALVFALATGLAYALVLVHLDINSVAKLKAWLMTASHENNLSGVMRAVFGLARSFINMGNDGLLFKRFLVKDPFNPVSASELFCASLWKLGLFYLLLLALVVNLLRSRAGRREILVLWLLGSLPVLAFGIFFDGGAVERYLPLYPFMFLALAYSLDDARVPPTLSLVALVFIAAAILTNTSVMAKTVLNRQQEATAERIKDLQPRLKSQSKVFTVNWQDNLVNFNRSFPFHPINLSGNLRVGSLVTQGTMQAARWREDFAKRALAVWDAGGDVWVSRRALSERPRPDWSWVEDDPEGVSWADFSAFFKQFEMGETVGGDDGFFQLAPSTENRQALERALQAEQLSQQGIKQ